jgi:hypothetical protein
LSGTEERNSIGFFLHNAVDGRHETVSVVVPVKEYGLVKLQFEFASDINAESHAGSSAS